MSTFLSPVPAPSGHALTPFQEEKTKPDPKAGPSGHWALHLALGVCLPEFWVRMSCCPCFHQQGKGGGACSRNVQSVFSPQVCQVTLFLSLFPTSTSLGPKLGLTHHPACAHPVQEVRLVARPLPSGASRHLLPCFYACFGV